MNPFNTITRLRVGAVLASVVTARRRPAPPPPRPTLARLWGRWSLRQGGSR